MIHFFRFSLRKGQAIWFHTVLESAVYGSYVDLRGSHFKS